MKTLVEASKQLIFLVKWNQKATTVEAPVEASSHGGARFMVCSAC